MATTRLITRVLVYRLQVMSNHLIASALLAQDINRVKRNWRRTFQEKTDSFVILAAFALRRSPHRITAIQVPLNACRKAFAISIHLNKSLPVASRVL